jgi:hypothetical protein
MNTLFWLFAIVFISLTMAAAAVGVNVVVNGPPTWGCK